MKAVIFFGPKEIRLMDVPVPRPGPGEVLLKIGAALTCGTDFKAYRQGHKVLLGDPPSPFGHELAGTVVESGAGAEAFTAGMRAVAANSAPCDRCFFCRRAQTPLCDHLKLLNGAYAQYLLVPAHIVKHNLHPLDAGMDLRVAALAEPLACALHAVDAMSVERGERIAILGAGNMSLLLLSALKARGACVLVMGRGPRRLEFARKAGADETASILETDPRKASRKWTEGVGPDCVFEAVGRADAWETALSMARKGGRVCLFGGCASGARVEVDAHRVHYEQLTLRGVFHHTPEYFRRAVELLSKSGVPADLLIEGQIALEEVPEYFRKMQDRSPLKTAVVPA